MADEYDALSLFASRLLSHPSTTFGDRDGDHLLRLLQAALSAGPDVPALLHTRSAARRLLQDRAKEAFAFSAAQAPPLHHARILALADFFARAFALVADVQSCLAMRYEALLLRHANFSDNHHLKVSRDEWFTFAKDALHNGFYTIASKAFAHATAHTHGSHPRQFDSTDSIDKDMINDITGLQTLAKSLSAKHSVQTQSAEYMKRRKSGVHEKYNLQSGKPKLPGTSMYMLGIKTRNIKKLFHSRERNLGDILKQS